MAKVIVDVSNSIVNAAVKKELKRLQTQVNRLKTNNEKLKAQIRQRQEIVEKAHRVVNTACDIADEFREEWNND